MENNDILLTGEIDERANKIVHALLKIPEDDEFTIYINSPGGSLMGAISIASTIQYRRLKGTVVVTGECSSAALLPFAACQDRFISPCSLFLWHQTQHEPSGMESTRLLPWAERAKSHDIATNTMLAEMLDIPRELISDWEKQSRYFSAKEMTKAGLAELI